jgi:hypothetical protein
MIDTKIIFCLILIFLGVLVLTGCGADQDGQITIPETPMTQLPTPPVNTTSPTAARATQTPMPTWTQYNPTTPPTVTPKPTNTVTPTVIFGNQVVIFVDLGQHYYVMDSLDGVGRYVYEGGQYGERIYYIQSWDEGCEIIAAVDSGFAEINLQGDIVRFIFFWEIIPPDLEGNPHFFKISSDEKWISYRIGTGEFHDSLNLDRVRYDVEYLLIQSIDGKQGPYQVSSGGSTIIWAWSPDSQRVAYGDVDEAGIHQVYAVDPDGSQRYQLTSFDVDHKIEGLQWSPDSSRLAIEYWLSDNGSERDILVVNDEDHPRADLYRDLHLLWWKDEDTLLGFERQGYIEGVIKQLDVGSKQVVGSVHADTSGRNLIPYGSRRKVGFLNIDYDLSVYDTERHTVTDIPNISYRKPEIRDYLGVLDYMIASPDSFPGERECPGW